jgi:hypothetical protein
MFSFSVAFGRASGATRQVRQIRQSHQSNPAARSHTCDSSQEGIAMPTRDTRSVNTQNARPSSAR